MSRKRRSTPKPLPESGLTRLLKALNDNNVPRFKHPHSGVLLSEQSSYDAVYHVLQDEKHPDRYAIVTAALAALDANETEYTPIVGRDDKNNAIYDLKGLDAGHCRSCGAVIYWGITPKGKRVPLNQQGVSHFTDCPNARKHSKKNKQPALLGEPA